MLRIFLSHLRDDGVLARRLAEALKRAGHQPVLVEDEARIGDTALSVLERSLLASDVGVLCLSRAALADAWMQTEFQTVMSQQEARGRPVLVARFEWVQPQGSVAQRPAVDLLPEGPGWDEGLATLLEVIGRIDEGGRGKAWPLLWGIPPAPELFVDREEVLRQLHETLEPQPGQDGARAAVLIGPLGIGKRSSALRFAHDTAGAFPGGIWWCQEPGRTPEEQLARLFWKVRRYAPLAVRARFDSIRPGAPAEELAGAVRQALEAAHGPALLLIHDVEEVNWEGRLPGAPVSVLMIRQQGQGAVGRQIPVEPMPASVMLQLADALSVAPEDPGEREARFRLVSERVAGRPLALMLITLARQRGTPWSEIEQAWSTRAVEPRRPWAGTLDAPVFDAMVALLTPAMLRLVKLLASFARAPVPADWIGAMARDSSEVDELNQAAQGLRALGLIIWDGEQRSLSLHPFFHAWRSSQLQSSELEQLLGKNLGVMESWLRQRIGLLRPEQMAEVELLLPHFLLALEATRDWQPSEAWIRFAVEVSTILKLRSDYPLALAWLERALARADQLQSTRYQLGCLVELASTLYSVGWEKRAEPYVQRALELADGLPPEPGPEFIDGLNKLSVLLGRRDPERARQLGTQAVHLAERAFGPDNEQTAVLLGNLAVTIDQTGEPSAAIPLFQRALEVTERRWGEGSSYVSQLAMGLGHALAHRGDLAGARRQMERAVAIDERLLPPDHPEVADRLRGLAVTLMQMGEFAAAMPLLERALAIEEKKLGPEHPVLAYTLHNLGVALLEVGKVAEAEAMLLRAAALAEAGLSPDDPFLSSTRMALANAARRRGDTKAAGLHLERALDVGMTLYVPDEGPGHEALQKALRLSRGRHVNPEAYVTALTEALALAEREGDRANAARAALLLGAFEGRRGAWEAARKHVERGLRLAKQAGAPMLVAESHRLLGDASLHGSRYEDARLHYAEAIRRLDELGLSVRAARVRMLLLVMMLQLGRTEGLAEHAAALEAVLKEGRFTEPAERSEVEQILRLADAARSGTPHEPQGNTE
jgi:tetratricopeptide (TPR) repeat protein